MFLIQAGAMQQEMNSPHINKVLCMSISAS